VTQHNSEGSVPRHLKNRDRETGVTSVSSSPPLVVVQDSAAGAVLETNVTVQNPRVAHRTISHVAGLSLSLESVLWMTLILAGIVTRFWNLGYRALHHDESLHAYYSWVFSTGEQPYVHNPLMHGPFLFHANALIYLLFGASDATSRFMPALAGVLLVALPWLLRDRKFLGPWGALAASFMLLISPSFLYYTRYIRHDPYTAVGSLILFIAIFRYLERPQRRWMIISFASVAFLLANHEIVFAIVLAFVLVIWGALVWGRLRPLVPVHLFAVAAMLVVLVLHRIMNWSPLPAIPWEGATQAATRHFYEQVFTNPLVVSVILVGAGFVVGSVLVMRRSVRKQATEVGYLDAIFGDTPQGSIERGVLDAVRDPIGLVIGVGLSFFIFVSLFTTIFTNIHGLATSTYAPDGTLLYWLGQQGVRRGEQPWFYFFTESVQYEWLAIFLGLTALVVTGIRILRAAFGRKVRHNLLFSIFLAVWFCLLLAVLSWAGEKMPWLIVHFTLPAILLGSVLVNEVVTGAVEWSRDRHVARPKTISPRTISVVLTIALVMLAGAWFLVAARLTVGQWVEVTPGTWVRQIPAWAASDWWMMALPPIAAIVLIVGSAWLIGARRAAYGAFVSTLLVMTLFQVHAGFRLAFLEGDTAKDTLIYNTTSPDTTQLTSDVQEMSEIMYGDRSMAVQFDGCTQWPLNWYLRNMPDRKLVSDASTLSSSGSPVIVGVPQNWDSRCTMPEEIDGYTSQTYVLRWHEPESQIYRNFAIAPELPPGRSAWLSESQPHGLSDIASSVWSSMLSLTDPAGQQRAYRLLMYREMPGGENGYRFKVYIRSDTLPYYNDVRYGG
jgi:uncharacterized protein (TIGR03663 family)